MTALLPLVGDLGASPFPGGQGSSRPESRKNLKMNAKGEDSRENKLNSNGLNQKTKRNKTTPGFAFPYVSFILCQAFFLWHRLW